jgi:hypothetical protein
VNDQQKIIHWRLQERAPVLADLYKAAIFLIAMPEVPGRGYLIAHACREIYNALPEAYDIPSDYELSIKEITEEWHTQVSPDLAAIGDSPRESVAVPLELAQHVNRMVLRDKGFEGNRIRRFNAMCDAINPSALGGFTDPTIAAEWLDAKPHKVAHAARGTRSFVTREPGEAIEKFQSVERVLWALYNPADTAIRDLGELLREANE